MRVLKVVAHTEATLLGLPAWILVGEVLDWGGAPSTVVAVAVAVTAVVASWLLWPIGRVMYCAMDLIVAVGRARRATRRGDVGRAVILMEESRARVLRELRR